MSGTGCLPSEADELPPAVRKALRVLWAYLDEQRRAAAERRSAAAREVKACQEAMDALAELAADK